MTKSTVQKSTLDQLKEFTTVVVDSSDIKHLKAYGAQDATTNPSLVYQASQKPDYKNLIEEAVTFAKKSATDSHPYESLLLDRLLTNFGKEILKIVPGRVSTEVDARLSFDVEGSIKRAHQIIKLYENDGISRERILIKLASTWEGVLAATELEKQGIHCNMTLMFSLPQAIGAANAHATLVSPFVGRILDWYKANENFNGPSSDDPGVLSVREIYNYYKERNIPVQVMGASFRNTGEILELAGCDLLTISPKLLEELKQSDQTVTKRLTHPPGTTETLDSIDEKAFRWGLNENRMATEKLSDGIRRFTADTLSLLEMIAKDYA